MSEEAAGAGPDLTVILPTRNGSAWLADELEALAAQRWDRPWEIVFVDNDSDDATPDLLAAALEQMPVPARLITATDQRSLAHARNVGVDAARGRSVVFIDDDDVIAAGFVAAIGTALDDHELVGPAFDYERLNPAGAAAARGSFQTTGLPEHFGVPVVSGGGSACRRELWHEAGGNDPVNFARSAEDLDFSLRVARLGTVTPYFCPEAVYHVRLRGNARSAFRQARRFGRYGVTLYRIHGEHFGERPEPVAKTLRRMLGFAWRVRQLLDEHQRLTWMWQAGVRVGRIEGSIRERRWYL